MRNRKVHWILKGLVLGAASLLLAGCQGGILDPKGQIGADEKNLILIATGLMLIVVIPVIFLTLFFAWKYRAGNTNARYEPKWSHSSKIEAVCWGVPILIIIILGTITWITTHQLDPYKPIDHHKKHLNVQVVSLNWKWLFIYPDQGIATVNQLVMPTDTPVAFTLTSDTVMNSFFIPQLGSQIYTMTGMKTKLHLIANEPGTYKGYSSNYSGAGFTGMKFNAIATKTDADFDAWVQKVKASGNVLNDETYAELKKPSENNPVTYYSSVKPGLFHDLVMHYMKNYGRTLGMPEQSSMDMSEGMPAGSDAGHADEHSGMQMQNSAAGE